MNKRLKLIVGVLVASCLLGLAPVPTVIAQNNPQDGAIGLEARIPTDPPKVGATISFPTNGQTFRELPIDVTGVCPSDYLIKLFKNNVFSGSAICTNGGFEITTDLFSGENALVARVFDSLDQAGPDSNRVTVEYQPQGGASSQDQVLITSNFAKRGANPGERLRWPIAISGGVSPYAVSVDWGDGKSDLLTRPFAGEFSIEHRYDRPGVYRILIKASDSRRTSGFFQVIAVINGPLSQDSGNDEGVRTESREVVKAYTWPLIGMFILMVGTFWVGRRYELNKIRRQIESQDDPF